MGVGGDLAGTVAKHEERWAAFKASPPEEIRMGDVPWPPVQDNPLGVLPGDDVAAVKAKCKAAVLRSARGLLHLW